MALFIDGHNLIPYIKGIDLADIDDEMALIQRLQDYARLRRKTVTVYFDGAPAGRAGEQHFGRVLVHFVPQRITADDAIITQLRQMGKSARNAVVVSSDRQVQQAARAVHATVRSSQEFAAEWEQLAEQEPDIDPRNRPLTEAETAAWEQLFKRGHPTSKKEK